MNFLNQLQAYFSLTQGDNQSIEIIKSLIFNSRLSYQSTE